MLETEGQWSRCYGRCRVEFDARVRAAGVPGAFGPTTERVEMEAVCGVEGAVGMEME